MNYTLIDKRTRGVFHFQLRQPLWMLCKTGKCTQAGCLPKVWFTESILNHTIINIQSRFPSRVNFFVYCPISTKSGVITRLNDIDMRYTVTISEHLWQYSDPIDRPSVRVSRPSNLIKKGDVRDKRDRNAELGHALLITLHQESISNGIPDYM